MIFDHNWGDSWRGTFKKLLWFSVFAFELTAIALIYGVVTWYVPEQDAHLVLVILFSVVATLFNSVIHCVWGCIVYMFEDIAKTREVNCALAEYIVARDNELHPELNKDDVSKAPAVRNTSSDKKVYRSISERSKDDKSAAEFWICPECGTKNISTASFCKDCGTYK